MVRRFGISAVLLAALVACSGPGVSGGIDNITAATLASTEQSNKTPDLSSSPASTAPAGPPETDTGPPKVLLELTEPACDDDSSCAAGFYLDGIFFGLDCTAIRAAEVTTDVLGVGTVSGQQVAAHAIADIDPSSFVAVGLPGGGACYAEDPSEPSSVWSLAIRQSASSEQIRDTVCAVADYTPERRRASGCEPLD